MAVCNPVVTLSNWINGTALGISACNNDDIVEPSFSILSFRALFCFIHCILLQVSFLFGWRTDIYSFTFFAFSIVFAFWYALCSFPGGCISKHYLASCVCVDRKKAVRCAWDLLFWYCCRCTWIVWFHCSIIQIKWWTQAKSLSPVCLWMKMEEGRKERGKWWESKEFMEVMSNACMAGLIRRFSEQKKEILWEFL